MALVIFGMCLILKQNLLLAFIVYIPLYGFSLAWFQYFYTRFRINFKRDVINALILHCSAADNYLPNKFTESTLFDKCQLFDLDHDFYDGEDLIEFNNFGNLKISELSVIKQEQYKDHQNQPRF